MKKITNVTIGGRVFAIEDDAYAALSSYLEHLEAKLGNSPDYAEIIEDIEHALADKFTALGRGEHQAVTDEDVTAATAELGTADEVAGEDAADSGSTEQQAAHDRSRRRLYRDPDNAILGGVASGLAHYFDVDPVALRLLFVVLVFFNGIGILAYVILWLLMPAARTTTDRYAMRGERVTITEITERVKKNLTGFDTYADTAQGFWGSFRPMLERFFAALGSVARAALWLARLMAGAALLLFGAGGIAALVGAASGMILSHGRFANEHAQAVSSVILSDPAGYGLMVAGLAVVLLPLVLCLLLGVSLLRKRFLVTLNQALMLVVLWLAAAATMAVLGVMNGQRFIDELRAADPSLFLQNHEERLREAAPPLAPVPPQLVI